jgi:hypothetical protein
MTPVTDDLDDPDDDEDEIPELLHHVNETRRMSMARRFSTSNRRSSFADFVSSKLQEDTGEPLDGEPQSEAEDSHTEERWDEPAQIVASPDPSSLGNTGAAEESVPAKEARAASPLTETSQASTSSVEASKLPISLAGTDSTPFSFSQSEAALPQEDFSSMAMLQDRMTSAAMDNDALQAEMALLQQKQDSLTAELEDNVDQEISNLRQQLVTDGDPFADLDTSSQQSQTSALLSLPKLPIQDEDNVVKLSAAVSENKHLQDGVLASAMAEEQALEQHIETAKSRKHELGRQLSQASEQGARLQTQVEEVSQEESQLVQQQQVLVLKQKELLQAVETAAPAEKKAIRQQIASIAGETDNVTQQIADASAQRTHLNQEMAAAYLAVQTAQQEQIAVVATEQVALKQHLELCAAKEASLVLLMETADPATAALLQQEQQNAQLNATLIKEREETSAVEANQIKNAVAAAAVAEERVFKRRMEDAEKVQLEKQSLNEQMITNAHAEQEMLRQQLESATGKAEQDELGEQISRASKAESRAAEAQKVDAEATKLEKRALTEGLQACAAIVNRVEATVASAEKRVLVGQRVAAASAHKHTCSFIVADSEQTMNDFQSELVTTTETKDDLERQLEVNEGDESIMIAYADAADACSRAEKWVVHQSQQMKGKEEELAEATSIERKLQREYAKDVILPASANASDLEHMVKELKREKEQMQQELKKERNTSAQRLRESKAGELALLQKAQANPEAAQHVQQVIEAQTKGALNSLKAGPRSTRPKRKKKVMNASDPEDVKQTTVKYAAMDVEMKELVSKIAANPSDQALVQQKDGLEEGMHALEDVMHEWGVHCSASVLSEVVRQLAKPQIGTANSSKRAGWVVQAEVLRKVIAGGGGWGEAILLDNGDIDLNMDLDIWAQADQVNILKRMKDFLQETLETQFLSLSSDKDRLKNNMILTRNKLAAEKKRGDQYLKDLETLRSATPTPGVAQTAPTPVPAPAAPAPSVVENVSVVDTRASVDNVVRTVEAAQELSQFCAAQATAVLPQGETEVILGHVSSVSQKTEHILSLARTGDLDLSSMSVLFEECDQLEKATANTVKETIQELVAAFEERGNAPPIVVDDSEDYAATISQLKQQLAELGSKVEQYQLDLAASLEKERKLKEAHTASELEKMQLAMKLKDVEGELAKQGVDPNMRIALEYVKEKTTNKLDKVQHRLDDLRLERYYNISDMIESYKFTAPRSVVNVNGVQFKSIADWAVQKKQAGGAQFLKRKRRPRMGGLARKSDLPPVQGLPCGAGFASSAAAAAQVRAERNKQHHSLHTRVFVHSNRQEHAPSPLASDHDWYVLHSSVCFNLLTTTYLFRRIAKSAPSFEYQKSAAETNQANPTWYVVNALVTCHVRGV